MKSPKTMELAQLLTDFRAKYDWSTAVFASRCGWSYTTVWRLENGITPFSRRHLYQMLSMEVLVEGSVEYHLFEDALKRQESTKFFFGAEELKGIIEKYLSMQGLPRHRDDLEAMVVRKVKDHLAQLGCARGKSCR